MGKTLTERLTNARVSLADPAQTSTKRMSLAENEEGKDLPEEQEDVAALFEIGGCSREMEGSLINFGNLLPETSGSAAVSIVAKSSPDNSNEIEGCELACKGS